MNFKKGKDTISVVGRFETRDHCYVNDFSSDKWNVVKSDRIKKYTDFHLLKYATRTFNELETVRFIHILSVDESNNYFSGIYMPSEYDRKMEEHHHPINLIVDCAELKKKYCEYCQLRQSIHLNNCNILGIRRSRKKKNFHGFYTKDKTGENLKLFYDDIYTIKSNSAKLNGVDHYKKFMRSRMSKNRVFKFLIWWEPYRSTLLKLGFTECPKEKRHLYITKDKLTPYVYSVTYNYASTNPDSDYSRKMFVGEFYASY
jgi:hypothetical protein